VLIKNLTRIQFLLDSAGYVLIKNLTRIQFLLDPGPDLHENGFYVFTSGMPEYRYVNSTMPVW